MDNPLKPAPSLLCKLGSILVHTEELYSAKGHAYDFTVLQGLYADPEVVDWMAGMRAFGYLPVKR